MGKKCRSCGTKVIEYPIWEGQEHGEPFKFSKINWYNAIIGDWTKFILLATMLLAVWAYAVDTANCREVMEHPCDFVDANYRACQSLEEQNDYIIPNMDVVTPINIEPIKE